MRVNYILKCFYDLLNQQIIEQRRVIKDPHSLGQRYKKMPVYVESLVIKALPRFVVSSTNRRVELSNNRPTQFRSTLRGKVTLVNLNLEDTYGDILL